MRALVAEDHPAVRMFHARWVAALGFDVVTVACGADAKRSILQALDSCQPYDLLVLDNDMRPGPHGVEILRQLRDAGDDTPVLLVTGLDPFNNQSWWSRAAVLQKPSSAAVVEQAIRELVPGLEAA